MKTIKRRFKVLILRIKRWIYLSLNPDQEIAYSAIQKKAEKIILNAIDDNDSKIYHFNDALYIKNDYFTIKIFNTSAFITNDSFSYFITIPTPSSRKIYKRYRENVYAKISQINKENDTSMINNLSSFFLDI